MLGCVKLHAIWALYLPQPMLHVSSQSAVLFLIKYFEPSGILQHMHISAKKTNNKVYGRLVFWAKVMASLCMVCFHWTLGLCASWKEVKSVFMFLSMVMAVQCRHLVEKPCSSSCFSWQLRLKYGLMTSVLPIWRALLCSHLLRLSLLWNPHLVSHERKRGKIKGFTLPVLSS